MAKHRRPQPRAQATVVNVRTNGHGKQKTGWFAASPAAWIALATTILLNAAQFVYVFANMEGKVTAVGERVQRHEGALEKLITIPVRVETLERGVNRIDASLTSIGTLTSDVAVIKAQLTQLNENFRLLQAEKNRGK